ncbi:MAG: NlpC/P60 family protein [Lachnospiraceae bacterium]|nr:NlpC/P60 family protein [Lachnospiraceae bacterium]
MIKYNRVLLRAVSLGLAGTLVAATPVYASSNSILSGISAILEETTAEEETMAVSGVAQVTEGISEAYINARNVLADSSVKYEMTEEEVEAQVELASQIDEAAEAENTTSPYDNIAISQVNNYVNIRSEASEEGEILGKIYNNAAATILDTVETDDGTWYYIESGSVTGYIKSNYFVTGEAAEAIAYEVGTVKATVSAETLRLRSEASTESSTITLLSEDEKYDVIDQVDGFVEISIDDDMSGYVSSDYVTIEVEFEKAISIEEEKAAEEAKRIAEESAAAAAAEEAAASEAAASQSAAEAAAAEEAQNDSYDDEEDEPQVAAEKPEETTAKATTEATTEAPTTTTEAETTTEAPTTTTEEETKSSSSESTSSIRSQIVDYALSFVGNLRYVYGGNSLSSGVDCSGFVQQIYKHFGYSLPRTSDSQGSSGKSVSSSEMQPGDLVYYGGHIAIYIGNGQVVHASNAKTGVKVSTWNYRTVKSIRNVLG